MTEVTIEQIKTELNSWKGKVEEQVKKIVGEGNSDTDEKVKNLQDELNKANDLIKSVEEQMKQNKAAGVPGLKESLEKEPFSWTSYVGGLYKQAYSGADGHGDPWKGAEHEKDIVEDYAKQRTNVAGDGTAGAYLIPPEVTNEIIDLTIAAMPIMNMGPTIVRGLRGELPVPKLTGRPTGYMVGENEKPTASNATHGQEIMRPKKCGAFTKQSNRLIYQSRGVSDSIIKEQIRIAMALKMHEMLVKGNGTDKQPLGITNASGFTSNNISLGANGGRFRIDHAAAMQTALDAADELVDAGAGSFGYLVRPEVKGGMKRERSKQFSDQPEAQGLPIIMMNPLVNDKVLENMIGYPLKTTTQITATDVVGSSSTCSKALFGNWKYFWVALWRDFAIKVSDVAGDGSTGSAFLEDMMYIVAFQEFDCHCMRGSAFTQVTGAETDENEW